MSRVGEVLSFERVVEEGAHGADVKVDPGGTANVTAPHYADAGDDSHPLPGDFVALEDSSGAGAEQATGYADVRNAGKARAGEKRIYARNVAGAPVVEVWLKNDGSIVIANGTGAFELAPSGAVTINGVTISPSGAISAPGEITAKSTTTPVSLTQHIHPTGLGPSGAPTPGT